MAAVGRASDAGLGAANAFDTKSVPNVASNIPRYTGFIMDHRLLKAGRNGYFGGFYFLFAGAL
jgi:hypothetical protein